ncbi:GlsB/YeaQ/YmgE family stress response membrane protein [Ilumatobacter nonamiensis]|uniref:GlsB/YeaQ/YmgE family stress response membrane protein n=1 Tax=Ilumatobacter nonamiensis TaxID=467093 RepID=UPI000347C29D|nr:GlsB/YeaQ/YmgE family stress response membrane protein [Ilumatobacter nonamiensis]
MSVLGWIVVGLIAGVLARWIVRDDRGGCIYSLVIGVLGAFIGGWLMSLVDNRGVDGFSIYSILVAALGAILLLLIVHAISGGGRRSRSGR